MKWVGVVRFDVGWTDRVEAVVWGELVVVEAVWAERASQVVKGVFAGGRGRWLFFACSFVLSCLFGFWSEFVFFFYGSVGLRGFCVLFCFQGVFQLLKGDLLIVDARALASDNHSFQQVLSYLLSNLDGFHSRPFNSPVLEYTELIELRWALNVKGQYGVSLVGSSDSSFCLTILLLAVLGLVFVKALYWFVGDVLWFV